MVDRRTSKQDLQNAIREQSLLHSIRETLSALLAAGEPHEVLRPAEFAQPLLRFATLAAVDERVDWLKIADARLCQWGSEEKRRLCLKAALAECADASDELIVIWHPHNMPGLRLDIATVERHCDLILEQYSETWILPACEGDWLIECSLYDQQLCHSPNIFAK